MTHECVACKGRHKRQREHTTWVGRLGRSEKTRVWVWEDYARRVFVLFSSIGNKGRSLCPKGIAAGRVWVNLVEAGGGYHLKVVILCLMTHKHPTGCPLVSPFFS